MNRREFMRRTLAVAAALGVPSCMSESSGPVSWHEVEVDAWNQSMFQDFGSMVLESFWSFEEEAGKPGRHHFTRITEKVSDTHAMVTRYDDDGMAEQREIPIEQSMLAGKSRGGKIANSDYDTVELVSVTGNQPTIVHKRPTKS